MTVDHLLKGLSQARTLSDPDHLLDNTTLIGILNLWLFDCQEKNYSQKTYQHYRDKVGEFLEFLGKDITTPEQVTENHIRFFFHTRKQVNKKHPGQPVKAWTN